VAAAQVLGELSSDVHYSAANVQAVTGVVKGVWYNGRGTVVPVLN
jgi:hypothetical protein